LSNTDFESVAVFAKVIEAGSFRGAAKLLAMPKSTVSYKVSELEDRLGVRLLERTTRALRLTDAGRQYHAEVLPALEALEQADRRAAELTDEPRGLLRVTVPVELGQLVLGEVVSEYLTLYPGVKLELDLTDRRVDLIEEGFDLAIRVGPLADSTLVARRLGEAHRIKLFASRSYLKQHGVPERPSDLREHACLAMSGSQTPTQWRFVGKRGPLVVEIEPRVMVNSYRLLGDYVAAGLGLSFLPLPVVTPLLKRKVAVSVLEAYLRPAVAWHAVYPSARYLSLKVRAFVELLEARFRQGPWLK
jgi:DNA-binding transcriptional LysR family regulator